MINESEENVKIADVLIVLKTMTKTRQDLYVNFMNIHKNIRINERLRCIFRKWSENDGKYSYITVDLPKDKYKQKCNATFFNKDQISDVLNKNNEILVDAVETYIENGSNYQLFSIGGMYCNIDKYQPLRGRSYIQLPNFLSNKKCCINVKNNDNLCFAYALCSCLEYDKIKKNHDRTTSYKMINDIVTKIESLGIAFPVQIITKNIEKIEKALDIAINIYSYDVDVKKEYVGNDIFGTETYNRYPVYNTKRNDIKPTNLLYFSNDETNYHFVWIKNFNAFLADVVNSNNKKYYCTKCLLHFYSQEKLDKHNKDFPDCNDCKTPAKLTLPNKKEAFIEFKNFNKKFKCPFVIYADFECLVVDKKENTLDNITHNHEPCGFMFYVVSSFEEFKFEPKFYRGPYTVEIFLREL